MDVLKQLARRYVPRGLRQALQRRSFADADVHLDLREDLPFPDGSASLVYSEHVLEHFTYPQEVQHIVREVGRILAPGGVFKLVVPDVGRALQAYGTGDTGFFAARGLRSYLARERPTPMHIVNYICRQDGQHKSPTTRRPSRRSWRVPGLSPAAGLRSGPRLRAPIRGQQSLHGSHEARDGHGRRGHSQPRDQVSRTAPTGSLSRGAGARRLLSDASIRRRSRSDGRSMT